MMEQSSDRSWSRWIPNVALPPLSSLCFPEELGMDQLWVLEPGPLKRCSTLDWMTLMVLITLLALMIQRLRLFQLSHEMSHEKSGTQLKFDHAYFKTLYWVALFSLHTWAVSADFFQHNSICHGICWIIELRFRCQWSWFEFGGISLITAETHFYQIDTLK